MTGAVVVAVGALAGAGIAVLVRTWRRGYERRTAIATGVIVGVAIGLNSLGFALVPLLLLGALGPVRTRGTVARRYFAWTTQALVVAAVVALGVTAARNAS